MAWPKNYFSSIARAAWGAEFGFSSGIMRKGMRGAGSAAMFMARNPVARSALYGGLAGGLYGAFSDNTSVLGGAMMGAGLGAGIYRYGIRPGMGLGKIGAGMSFGAHARALGGAYGSAMGTAIMSDVRGARMASNRALNGIRGLGGRMVGGSAWR